MLLLDQNSGSESLAKSRWQGVDPIGRTIEFGNMDGDVRLLTIVGIVGDTREYGPEQPPRPTVYVNLMQRPRFSVSVVMRLTGDAGATTTAARPFHGNLIQPSKSSAPVHDRAATRSSHHASAQTRATSHRPCVVNVTPAH